MEKKECKEYKVDQVDLVLSDSGKYTYRTTEKLEFSKRVCGYINCTGIDCEKCPINDHIHRKFVSIEEVINFLEEEGIYEISSIIWRA